MSNVAHRGTDDKNNDFNQSLLLDYATRYEQLLIESRRLHSTPPHDPPQAQGHRHQGEQQESALFSSSSRELQTERTIAILSNHAAIAGMLEATIKVAKRDPDFSGDRIESIEYLLDDTLHSNHYGLDAAGQRLNCETSVTLGDAIALAAIEQSKKFDSQMRAAQMKTVQNQKSGQDRTLQQEMDSDNEADAFFMEYPECVDNDWSYFEVEDVEDENDFHSIKNDATKAPLNSQGQVGNNDRALQANMNVDVNMQVDQINQPYQRPNKKSMHNPYTKQTMSTMNNQNNQAWDAYNAKNEDPVHQQNRRQHQQQQKQHKVTTPKDNPFRTAKEVEYGSNAGDGYDNGADTGYQNNLNYGNTMQNGGRGNLTEQNDANQPYNPKRPNLSQGLRRKFQPPKLRPNGNNNVNRTSNSSSNGRNSKSNGGQSSRPNDNHAKDEDDDLPEELKGLDKELVSKIENEIVDSGDPITFQDIAGLKDAKQTVMELVCWPMKRPDLFTGLRRGPNGLLLFGPPGTGKTLIGKAIAHESGATFFSISSSSLTSKWIGEGEKLVRTLFAVAAYKEPAVVFIDEIDSLLTQRKADENEASRRIKTEFLVQLDGTGTSGQGRVLAIGATNRPHELDDAARRRFVKRLYIPLPEAPDREMLLRTLLTKNKHSLSAREITKLSKEGTQGFSGADLKALCTDAALGPIRQLGIRALEIDAAAIPPISYRHFRHALKGMNPSVAKADLDAYIAFNETYGSKNVSAEDYDGLSEEESDDGEA